MGSMADNVRLRQEQNERLEKCIEAIVSCLTDLAEGKRAIKLTRRPSDGQVELISFVPVGTQRRV